MRKPKVDPNIADFIKRLLAPLLADKVLTELRQDRQVDSDSSAQIELEKARNTKFSMSETLQMSFDQAKYELENAINNYETQKNNLKLSYKIFHNTSKKYKEGMVSSMELTQSHTQYLENNSNYINTILDLVNAKLKLDNILNQ